VIPVKDSGKTLGQCLKSLNGQDFRGFEIIVVDGGSSDDTLDIARRGGAAIFSFQGSVPGARNFGFSKSAGRILVSIDSDMAAEPGLLSDIASSMDGHGALVIPESGCGKSFLSRCKTLEKSIYLNDSRVEAARAFTREAFETVGGYDAGLRLAEDRDLHWRISRRFTIGRTSRGLIHCTDNLTLAGDLRKSFSYGKSLPAYISRKESDSGSFLAFHRSASLKYLSRLKSDPIHTIGLIALRALEYLSGAAGYLAARLGL